MPKIPTIFATAQDQLSTAPMIAAAHTRANAISDLGTQVAGAAEAIYAPHEISSLSKEYAQTTAQLAEDSNKFWKNASPDDPEAMDKYQKTVLDPALDKFGQGPILSKRAGELAQSWREDMRQNYTKTALSDQSAIAGHAVYNNLSETSNALSQGSYADPTHHAHFQHVWDTTIEEQIKTHQLTPEQAGALRDQEKAKGSKEIAMAAGRAMAENNPTAAAEDLSSGQFNKYLDGQEISSLKDYANAQQRASMTAQKAQAEEQRRVAHEDFQARSSSAVVSMIQPDGTLTVPTEMPKMIAQLSLHPGASAGEIKSLTDMMARVNHDNAIGKYAVTDPQTYADLSARMSIPAGADGAISLAELNEGRAHGLISDRDYRMFHQSTADMARDPVKRDAYAQFAQFERAMRSSITKSNILAGIVDWPGDQKFYQFQQASRQAFDAAYKNGNWRDLIDPHSKQYLGNSVTRYSQSSKETQSYLGAPVTAIPPPATGAANTKRLPGESAADYLKRVH